MMRRIWGVIGVVSGVEVIMGRELIKSVISLVVVFIVTAIMWIEMGMEGLGWILIAVYVGAVVILFIFTVILVGSMEEEVSGIWKQVRIIQKAVVVQIIVGVGEWSEQYGELEWEVVEDMDRIGQVLFGELGLEVLGIGVLLLVGMLGGVRLVR